MKRETHGFGYHADPVSRHIPRYACTRCDRNCWRDGPTIEAATITGRNCHIPPVQSVFCFFADRAYRSKRAEQRDRCRSSVQPTLCSLCLVSMRMRVDPTNLVKLQVCCFSILHREPSAHALLFHPVRSAERAEGVLPSPDKRLLVAVQLEMKGGDEGTAERREVHGQFRGTVILDGCPAGELQIG